MAHALPLTQSSWGRHPCSQLYQQKWRRFGWYMHGVLRAIDVALVAAVMYLCVHLKGEGTAKHQFFMCKLLIGLIAVFVAKELFLGHLYALNFKSGVPAPELIRRTWRWMRGFAIETNLRACAVLMTAVAVYMLTDTSLDMPSEISSVDGGRSLRSHFHSRELAEALEYTEITEAQRTDAMFEYATQSAKDASVQGTEPLIWLLMALGVLSHTHTPTHTTHKGAPHPHTRPPARAPLTPHPPTHPPTPSEQAS